MSALQATVHFNHVLHKKVMVLVCEALKAKKMEAYEPIHCQVGRSDDSQSPKYAKYIVCKGLNRRKGIWWT